MPYEVAVRDEPARSLVAVEALTTPEHHIPAGFELFARLRTTLEALGLPLIEPVVCFMPEPPDADSMILQMSSGCAPDLDASRAEALRIDCPAGPFAFVIHRGPYEERGLAQHAIAAWVEERGERTAGPLREKYTKAPAASLQQGLRSCLSRVT